MKLNIKSKQNSISEAVQQHFEKKLQRLEKFFGRDVEIFVNCSKEKGQERVEIALRSNGTDLRSVDHAGDLYSALDLAAERMERQIEKYKTRLDARRRDRESIRKATPERLPELATRTASEDPDQPHIVRSKRFALKPVDPEEACLQMELLGHNFYVFLNAETNLVNVVYRRNDGDYGLIEPGEE